MTAAGHAALESELKRRTSEERPRIIEQIAEARGHGDLSENAEYHAAKEAHGHNEGRITELEDQLSRAEIIDVSKLIGLEDHQVRRDRDAGRRGHRGEEEVPDRRRRRSRREGRARSRSPRRSRAPSSARPRATPSRSPRPAARAPTRSSTSSTGRRSAAPVASARFGETNPRASATSAAWLCRPVLSKARFRYWRTAPTVSPSWRRSPERVPSASSATTSLSRRASPRTSARATRSTAPGASGSVMKIATVGVGMPGTAAPSRQAGISERSSGSRDGRLELKPPAGRRLGGAHQSDRIAELARRSGGRAGEAIRVEAEAVAFLGEHESAPIGEARDARRASVRMTPPARRSRRCASPE